MHYTLQLYKCIVNFRIIKMPRDGHKEKTFHFISFFKIYFSKIKQNCHQEEMKGGIDLDL